MKKFMARMTAPDDSKRRRGWCWLWETSILHLYNFIMIETNDFNTDRPSMLSDLVATTHLSLMHFIIWYSHPSKNPRLVILTAISKSYEPATPRQTRNRTPTVQSQPFLRDLLASLSTKFNASNCIGGESVFFLRAEAVWWITNSLRRRTYLHLTPLSPSHTWRSCATSLSR